MLLPPLSAVPAERGTIHASKTRSEVNLTSPSLWQWEEILSSSPIMDQLLNNYIPNSQHRVTSKRYLSLHLLLFLLLGMHQNQQTWRELTALFLGQALLHRLTMASEVCLEPFSALQWDTKSMRHTDEISLWELRPLGDGKTEAHLAPTHTAVPNTPLGTAGREPNTGHRQQRYFGYSTDTCILLLLDVYTTLTLEKQATLSTFSKRWPHEAHAHRSQGPAPPLTCQEGAQLRACQDPACLTSKPILGSKPDSRELCWMFSFD